MPPAASDAQRAGERGGTWGQHRAFPVGKGMWSALACPSAWGGGGKAAGWAADRAARGVFACPAAPKTTRRSSASSPRPMSSTSKVQATSSTRINLKNSSLLSSTSCRHRSAGDRGFCEHRVGPEELRAVTWGSERGSAWTGCLLRSPIPPARASPTPGLLEPERRGTSVPLSPPAASQGRGVAPARDAACPACAGASGTPGGGGRAFPFSRCQPTGLWIWL